MVKLPLKKKIITFIVAFFAIVISVFGTMFLAVASGRADSDESGASVSRSFELNQRLTGVTDENISIKTATSGAWSVSSLTAPFTNKHTIPVRSSSDPLPRSSWGPGKSLMSTMPGNGYVPGQCTWYAYNRRWQMGRPIAGTWGDAGAWSYAALSQGWIVNNTPEVGAVIVFSGGQDGAGYVGHVGIVEELGTDNSVHISEMNYLGAYNYNERWILNASSHKYIH
ncbi:MAG: CHAP domain-containing protein [Candidatus Ancillula sp.]|jgi:surface antigen|nr:CHAP domain-containing protein [Candidatus Ancillula sp.]